MAGSSVPPLSIDNAAGAGAPAALESAKGSTRVNSAIEEIRSEAREQIEKMREETREISAEINRKRQEHMQKMLEVQKQKEQLEGEVCAALRPGCPKVGLPGGHPAKVCLRKAR
eukprot:82778-Prymnesium_polylepis.1